MKAITAGFLVGGRRFATLASATAAAETAFAKTGAIVAVEEIAALVGASIERMALAAGHTFGPGDWMRMGDRWVSWEYLMST